MCFMELADKSMRLDVTLFNEVYEARKSRLQEGAVVLIEGKVNHYNGKVGVVADNLTFYGITLPDDQDSEQNEEVSVVT